MKFIFLTFVTFIVTQVSARNLPYVPQDLYSCTKVYCPPEARGALAARGDGKEKGGTSDNVASRDLHTHANEVIRGQLLLLIDFGISDELEPESKGILIEMISGGLREVVRQTNYNFMLQNLKNAFDLSDLDDKAIAYVIAEHAKAYGYTETQVNNLRESIATATSKILW